MTRRVTIILDTGGFFKQESTDKTYLDVGYFETPNPSDIEVSEAGNTSLNVQSVTKLGRGNQQIDVQHVQREKIQSGVRLTDSFTKHILNKDDLYEWNQMPEFIPAAYDCIFRFHSGEFVSEDVRERNFTVHSVRDNSVIGEKKARKDIANEIHVHYDLEVGDVLRLKKEDGSDLWSSVSLAPGTTDVQVKILAHEQMNRDYHKRALAHRAEHYYMPNSDPPPQNGPSGG